MKRILLDTHVLLWWLADDPELGTNARDLISNGTNEIYVSAASSWEISIKKRNGKLTGPDNIDGIVQQERFIKLPISLIHGELAGQLPDHHKDPFDRMLIAQAQTEKLTILTADEKMKQYDAAVIMVVV
ncbi:MAG: type II toxin-antitoxin system VapC family toxin [Gammaproteobacteria bacterium]|nr:type II toxin-antitoxin system VapC family toxin [Gammaproteobacteria bacterium]